MVGLSDRQDILENNAKKYVNRQLDPLKKPGELFGPIEDWILTIGQYNLVLVPAINQWWFYNKAHESWEFTGHLVGEVVFSLKNGKLDPPKRRRDPMEIDQGRISQTTPSLPSICISCQQLVIPGNKFCSTCGAAVPATPPPPAYPGTCQTCGAPVLPGNKFCGNCSAAISSAPPPAPHQPTTCLKCGQPVHPGKKFCSTCGAPVGATASSDPQQPGACPNCGQLLKPGKKFCSHCGKKIE